jgi:hypothetical protein
LPGNNPAAPVKRNGWYNPGVGDGYTVRQGDFLSKIAKVCGFSNYRTIWNHPNNADLKQKRQNPNVLFPGDIVYIPGKQVRTESRGTNQKHVFVTDSPIFKLRLHLEDRTGDNDVGPNIGCLWDLAFDPS